uniref:GNAT family N-acetyltransferase n=1 Tax=Streptomyces sp. CHD11 TaxID=2741325 RepID=UPI00203FE92A|nr:GNAT family N-acetyltransferase [Streptomyces sp. CHD11]
MDDHVATHFHQGHIHCLTADGRPVGLTILDVPTIDLMSIDVGRHRQGLGRALLSHTEEILFTQCRELRLESSADNTTANAFYAACGWPVTKRLDSATPAKIELVKHRSPKATR